MHFAFGRHPRGFCIGGRATAIFAFCEGKKRKFPSMKKPTVDFFMRGAVSNLQFETAPVSKRGVRAKCENAFGTHTFLRRYQL